MTNKNITTNRLDIKQRNLPHWQIGGSWYFVTFKTKGFKLSNEAKEIISASIKYLHNKYYKCGVAVVMQDHVHILFFPLNDSQESFFSLQKILKSIKGFTAKKINNLLERKGAFWMPESFDRIIRNPKEWHEKYDYIKNNPVKAELVEKPDDYPWLIELEDFQKQF